MIKYHRSKANIYYHQQLFILVAVLTVCILSGCTIKAGSYTVISTQEFDPNAHYSRQGVFHGENSSMRLIELIPITKLSTMRAAIDSCLIAGKGNLIRNAEFTVKFTDFFFWQIDTYAVDGEVWKSDEDGSKPRTSPSR